MTELKGTEVTDLHDPLLNPLSVEEDFLVGSIKALSQDFVEGVGSSQLKAATTATTTSKLTQQQPAAPQEHDNETSFVQSRFQSRPDLSSNSASEDLFAKTTTKNVDEEPALFVATEEPQAKPAKTAQSQAPPTSTFTGARGIALFSDSGFSEDTDRLPTQDELLFGADTDKKESTSVNRNDDEMASVLKITDDVEEVSSMLRAVEAPSASEKRSTTDSQSHSGLHDFGVNTTSNNDNLDDDLFAMIGGGGAGGDGADGLDVNDYIAKQQQQTSAAADDLFFA